MVTTAMLDATEAAPAPQCPALRDALLAWEKAPTLCAEEHGCRPYHRCWGLIRFLNGSQELVGSAAIEGAIAQLHGASGRVLVCGSADAAVPMTVSAAAARHQKDIDLVVVDRCRTGGMVVANRTKDLNAELEIVQSSIQDYHAAQFDVIVVHNLLGHLSEAERAATLAHLVTLSRPGTRMVIVQTLAESEAVWLNPHSEERRLNATRDLIHKAQVLGWSETQLDALAREADLFWQSAWRQPPPITFLDMKHWLDNLQPRQTRLTEYDGSLGGASSFIYGSSQTRTRCIGQLTF